VKPDAKSDAKPAKKKVNYANAWIEAKALLYEYRTKLAIGMGLMLISRAAGLVLPFTTKALMDEVVAKQRGEMLWPLALIAAGATAVQAVTSFALSQVVSIAGQRAITDLRRRVQARVLRLPVSFFDSTQSGILIQRVMSDAEGVRNLVGTGIVQLIGSMLSAAVALGVLFWINWRLTVATLVVIGTFGGVLAYAFKKLRPIFRERSKIYAEVSGRLGQALGGARVVKVYTAEKREEKVFATGAHRLFRNIASTITGTSAVTTLGTLVIGIVGLLLIVIGGRDLIAGRMTVGDWVMYTMFIAMVTFPIMQLASIGTQITEAFAGLDRIREIMQTPTEDADDAQKAHLAAVDGDIAFEHVWFEYRPDVPVLKDVTFVAKEGTTTALVGSSGSGKSTLISLIMAFARPLKGRIVVAGRDLSDVRMRDYRRQLGVVLQDNFLFDGTIADNIAFSRPGATLDEVKAVARIAHCEEFVSGFPDGYDTIVGERGVKLSGGQRQRVAIARAILADPKVLILDEATSSLDSEAENHIREGLRALRTGRTTFVIAHRLSTITSADQILVMEGGEIVERGTHAELLAKNGRYRQLYDKQYQIERDQFVNPGEDFTPEPAAPAVISARSVGSV
jgi:ABC-type multidrug transport system fused ATPase/permease subunit